MPDKAIRYTLSARDSTAAVFGGVLGRLKGMQAAAGALNASFGRVTGVLGGAAVGATFTAFIGHVVGSIDRLNDLRDATGASIPNLSALEDLAARTGTGFDGMAGTLIKFNKALQEAEPGSRTERVLQQIGLSAKELRDLDPAEALRRTAVALGTYATDGDKARIVQELFGKSIKEAGPFLAELAAKTRLVGTVTTEQAEAAERFNKELATLQKNATDAGRALVSDLLPPLNRIFEAQRQGGFSAAGGALLGLSQQDRESNALRNATRELAQAQERYRQAAEAKPDLFDAMFGSPEKREAKLNALEGELIKAQQTVDRLLGPQAERQAQAESDNEIARRFGTGRRSVGRVQDPEKKKSASLTAEQIAKLQVEAEEQAAKDSAEAWTYWERQRVKESEERAQAEKKMWQQIFDEIDAEQERAIEAGKAFLEKKIEQLSDFAQEARRNIQDFTGDALTAGLEGEFNRLDRLFGQLLKRMVAQALAADINRALFGKTGTAGDTGLLGFLFTAFGGARAEGGPVNSRTPYLVGERGPEIFVPGISGQVVSNREAGRMGGGVTINYVSSPHIDSRTDQAQVAHLVRTENARAQKAFVDQLKASGLMAGAGRVN